MNDRTLKFVCVAAWLNGVAWIAVASQIGDPLGGKISQGHYFLRTKWGFIEAVWRV